jgi:hypothetical protein
MVLLIVDLLCWAEGLVHKSIEQENCETRVDYTTLVEL